MQNVFFMQNAPELNDKTHSTINFPSFKELPELVMR